jgi:hypothetical protein
LFGRFFRDRRGNISMIFGLTLVPRVTAVGTGADYSLAARMKAKLRSAADAAAVASISENSPGYLQASQMTTDGIVAASQTDADGIFSGIMSTLTDRHEGICVSYDRRRTRLSDLLCFSGSNSATVIPAGSSSYCKPLKDRGIVISVLYIPYEQIQNPTAVFNNEDGIANANIPNIEPSLQDCASPGCYFKASTPADITTALTAMFNQALQTAHTTN